MFRMEQCLSSEKLVHHFAKSFEYGIASQDCLKQHAVIHATLLCRAVLRHVSYQLFPEGRR